MQIYLTAMERKDYTWELQHTFPYDTDDFRQTYHAMIAALEKGDSESLASLSVLLYSLVSELLEFVIVE